VNWRPWNPYYEPNPKTDWSLAEADPAQGVNGNDLPAPEDHYPESLVAKALHAPVVLPPSDGE
jgi:hypothetical protein